jgi:hypothetical protein
MRIFWWTTQMTGTRRGACVSTAEIDFVLIIANQRGVVIWSRGGQMTVIGAKKEAGLSPGFA